MKQSILFSKNDTLQIKGTGILLIVLHNFFHWVQPSTGENEFFFDILFFKNYATLLIDYPEQFVNLSFSFFGHYGVQLFIFISGYGLSTSYSIKTSSYFAFIKHRLLKVYPPFLIGVFVLCLYTFFLNKKVLSFQWGLSIIYKLLSIHIFLPEEALSINGPWWFFGLIIHFYFIFIPLQRLINRYGISGFLGINFSAYLLIFLLLEPLLEHKIYVMANVIGHLPEFTLGIFFASRKVISIRKSWFFIALITFSLGNIFFVFYPFTFLSIIIIFLFLFQYRGSILNWMKALIEFFGGYSLFIFVLHGFFRNIFISLTIEKSILEVIGFALAYLFFVTILSVVCQKIYNYLKTTL
ncbi:acyltransferase [Flammeovirga sp. MY04]|uniref:acyltransferase family protein n=1 Tax=Flammeovirga sp. MY04 TaxID=1191459 RepID=UPI0008063523|nr:acyltransferase [Flammeovirga sp. MY04]ANQ48862.1 acyltransferase [Flammeovirga sp. MY04]